MTKKRLGIDLGGTKIEAAVLDAHGDIVWRQRLPTPTPTPTPTPPSSFLKSKGSASAKNEKLETVYIDTLNVIHRLVKLAEADVGGCFSVGVAAPGALSTKTRQMKNCNSTCLNGRSLAQDLEQKLQRPIRIANDADCFALSEAIDGAAKEGDIVFGVIIGTGTGAGVIVNKKRLSGPNNIVGEWGHNPMPLAEADDRRQRPCYCGAFGCIETYLSGPGFEADYLKQTQIKRSATEIVSCAEGGDRASVQCLNQYAENMACALASIINVIDPHVIVLGGGMSNIRLLYTDIPRRWQQYVFSDEVLTRLVPAKYGDSSGVRGAAWLWNDDSDWQ